jgi:hypothetical protein
MNEPIMITPHDLITSIVWICGAIITVSGCIAVIVKAIQKARSPDKRRDEQLKDLDKRLAAQHAEFSEYIKEHAKVHDAYKVYFDNDKKRIEDIEENFKQSNRVIIATLQALVEHARHGNNIQQLDETNDELNEYLREK